MAGGNGDYDELRINDSDVADLVWLAGGDVEALSGAEGRLFAAYFDGEAAV